MSGFLRLSVPDWGSAVITAVIVAILGFVLSTGDIWIVDWKQAINVGVLAGLGRLLEALGTNREGNFAGAVPVK